MINWNTFNEKFNNREQWAFEQMSYFLFCAELKNYIGAFRYKNQPGIETEPIEKDGQLYAFQAKFYTGQLSQKKADIIDSINKVKSKESEPNIIFLYVNQEISKNKKREKPQYQIQIEKAAQNKNFTIEWRVRSHLEYQLLQPRNKWILDIFFGNNGLDPEFFTSQIEKEIKNLGPRFNKRLNFRLPIAKVFDNLSHNDIFYCKLIKTIDNWLTERSYRKIKDNESLFEIEKELELLRIELTNWINTFQYKLENSILLSDFAEKIKLLNKKVSKERNSLYEMRDLAKSNNKFENELSRLREIENNNCEFLKKIDDLNINLANNPTLIIQGEAGCGKSHLLGDIATQRKELFLPTLLLLGTTFNNSSTIEQNILNKLGLTCSFGDFLSNLNNIGLNINSRVLILIDAINEGAGADLWKNQIAGFVNVIANYPAIGLVFTIRSTYFNDIISTTFQSDIKNTFLTHIGFKGNEYEALKLFCEYYDLDFPNFPILNPEFSNPLFLHLICETIKNQNTRSFPKGFNGISKTYDLYKKSLNRRFDEKRHEYKNRNIVSLAIEKFAHSLINSKYGQLECQEAFAFFDTEFPQFPHLLSDLIEECVFIKMRYEYSEVPKDLISFSYQKLGDFFITKELLKAYKTKEDLKDAFIKDPKLKIIINEYQWSYRGITEIFSILFPEKYDVELFELIDFFIKKSSENKRNIEWKISNTYETFTRLLLDSLKWRDIKSINEQKITEWLEKNGRVPYEEWLYTLTELTPISKHPFNGDRLHKILSRYSMPKRDGFWQKYLRYYSGYNDDDIAFPLRRLLDWAWISGISTNTDEETARLVAQTLAWVLSSTDIALRDQTTKALVNLLEQKPQVLIAILKSFEKIDDLYVTERLYAVAYGCTLRTKEDDSIREISQYVYNIIFKHKNPPLNILLRDYARNIIEYAIYKGIKLNIEKDDIRPLYVTSMPSLPKSEDEVKKYQIDYNSPEFKNNYGSEQNSIYSSLISGIADFGHYIVKSAVNHFASYSIKDDDSYKVFLKTLKNETRDFVKLLFDSKKKISGFKKNTEYYNRIGKKYSEKQLTYIGMLEEIESTCLSQLENLLDKKQLAFLIKTVIPYFDKKINNEQHNAWQIRYWIVNRVFELGYDKEIHGEYDFSVRNYYSYNRYDNKIERIGKKYQWIAFYEIMAMLSDNYKLKDGWSSYDKYDFYKGAWQLYLRNIDPSYIKKNNDVEEEEEIDLAQNKEWWREENYDKWNYPDSEWVKTIADLVEPKTIIEKTDNNNEEWLHLQYFVDWFEPKKIGLDRYEGRRKQIHYIIQGLLVKKTDKKRIINYLNNQNFWGRWLPENRDDNSTLINREKFWSPAYIDTYGKNKRFWETIQDTNYKVIVATESANGGIEGDKSGANQSYNIPCKYIFNKMNLQYAPVDGNLQNCNNEIVSMNSTPSGVLIRKKDFIQFLDANNLDIVWTLLGEKFSFDNNQNEESYFKVPCGVYYLENSELKGEIKMYDRN